MPLSQKAAARVLGFSPLAAQRREVKSSTFTQLGLESHLQVQVRTRLPAIRSSNAPHFHWASKTPGCNFSVLMPQPSHPGGMSAKASGTMKVTAWAAGMEAYSAGGKFL